MMASEVVCGLIFRLILPVCLAAACLFRYNWLSFVYLIYLLLIPLFAEPTKTTMRGHTGRLLKALCLTSMTFLLLHLIFQITINSLIAGDNIEPHFNWCADLNGNQPSWLMRAKINSGRMTDSEPNQR